MKRLKIEDKEFELCNCWEELTFGQYIDLASISQEEENTPLEKTAKYIAAISNDFEVCLDYLYRLTPEDFKELQAHFDFLNKEIGEDIKKHPISDTLTFEGKTYKLKKNYDKLSLGEVVNLETILKTQPHLTQFEVGFGILIREIDEAGNEKEFSEESFVETIQTLKDKVKLVQVYSLLAFFLNGEKEYIKTTKGFSVEEITQTD